MRHGVLFLVGSTLTLSLLAGCSGSSSPSSPTAPVSPPVAPANNPAPMITSISPTSVLAGSPSQTLAVTGTGYITVSLASTFFAAAGSIQLVVSNPGTPVVQSNAATVSVVAPTLSFSISPNYATARSPDTKITVSGNGFFADSVVKWNNTVLATTYVNAKQLTAIIPASFLSGFAQASIQVSTPESPNQTLLPQPFTTFLALPINDIAYNAVDGLIYASIAGSAGESLGNTIAGIDPTSGVIVKTIFVGSEPTRMALSSDGTQLFVGLWNGQTLPTTFVSAGQMTATVDSSLIQNLGWAQVSVTTPTPGGGQSAGLPLHIYQLLNVPANVISFDPFTRKIYAALPSTSTTVTGNSLVAIDPATGSVSSLPGILFGQDGLAYVVPGTTTSKTPQIFLLRGPFVVPAEATTNPAPTLSRTGQATIAVGSSNLYLTVTGTGFLPGAVVLWNGSPRTTTFVDNAHLQVAIAAADLVSAQTITLASQNPGSGNSNNLTVTIQ